MRFFIKMCVSPFDLWSLGLSKKACVEQTNKMNLGKPRILILQRDKGYLLSRAIFS